MKAIHTSGLLKMNNKFIQLATIALKYISLLPILALATSFLFIFLDNILLNNLIYSKKPGFKTQTQKSYETYQTIAKDYNCMFIQKVEDINNIPKFEHYKCNSADFVWAKRESDISRDGSNWLIGD